MLLIIKIKLSYIMYCLENTFYNCINSITMIIVSILLLFHSNSLMLTCYNVITLYSQTVGHQGLRLQGNDLIRKEKEDTGVRKKLSALLDSLAALPGEDTIDPQ